MGPTPVCVRRGSPGLAQVVATPEARHRRPTPTPHYRRPAPPHAGTVTYLHRLRRRRRCAPTGTVTEARGTRGCPQMLRRGRCVRRGRSVAWRATLPRRASRISSPLSGRTTSDGQTRRRCPRPLAQKSPSLARRWLRARTPSPWIAFNVPKRARLRCRRLTPLCIRLRRQAHPSRPKSECARLSPRSPRTGRIATTRTRRRPCAVHRVVEERLFHVPRTRAGTTSTWEAASSPRSIVSCLDST